MFHKQPPAETTPEQQHEHQRPRSRGIGEKNFSENLSLVLGLREDNDYLFNPNCITPHREDPNKQEVEEDDERVVHVGEGPRGQGGKLEQNELEN